MRPPAAVCFSAQSDNTDMYARSPSTPRVPSTYIGRAKSFQPDKHARSLIFLFALPHTSAVPSWTSKPRRG